MYDMPETGFLRLPQVLRVIPVSKTIWWEGVKSGRFPKPIKLSARCTAWRAEDIHQLIKRLSEETNQMEPSPQPAIRVARRYRSRQNMPADGQGVQNRGITAVSSDDSFVNSEP